MIEQGPDVQGVLEQAEDVPDGPAPVLKIALDRLPGRTDDPLLVGGPFAVGFRLEGDNVHHCTLLDGEDQDVAVVAEPHDAVTRHLVAE